MSGMLVTLDQERALKPRVSYRGQQDNGATRVLIETERIEFKRTTFPPAEPHGERCRGGSAPSVVVVGMFGRGSIERWIETNWKMWRTNLLESDSRWPTPLVWLRRVAMASAKTESKLAST